MKWKAGFASVFSLAVVVVGLAQQPDETLPIFRPGMVFDSRGVDSVNVFNGDIGVAIPLGPGYTLGPTGYRWQLTASASAKFWTFSNCENPNNVKQFAYIAGDSALGVGWTLNLGYIVKRSPPFVALPFWLYHSQDGGQHRVNLATANPSTTSDGSRLRIKALPNITTPTSYTVEFPDGTVHTFGQQLAAPNPQAGSSPDFTEFNHGETEVNRFGLTSIADRFGNTLLTVTYMAAPNWRVSSISLTPLAKTITFTWTTETIGPVTWDVIDKIGFPAPAGQTLTTDFTFADASLTRNPYDSSTGDTTCPPASPELVDVPKLAQITFCDNAAPGCPDPSGGSGLQMSPFAYQFSYYDQPAGGVQIQGVIQTTTLPSLGTITYAYAKTKGTLCNVDPSIGCDAELGPEVEPPGDQEPQTLGDFAQFTKSLDHSPAVITRTQYDPFTGRSDVVNYTRQTIFCCGVTQFTNTVKRRVDVDEPGNDSGSPTRYLRRYYFHAEVPEDPGFQDYMTGVELDRRYYNGPTSGSANTVRSMISCYSGKCGYRQADGDLHSFGGTRIPPEAEVVWFDDKPSGPTQEGGTCPDADGATTKCIKTANTSSSYNSAAERYRNSTITTNLANPVTRATETNWTASSSDAKWFLDKFDHRFAWDGLNLPTGSNGSTVVRQYADFDPATGFLDGSWTWDSLAGKLIVNCFYKNTDGTIQKDFSKTETSTDPTTYSCPGSVPAVGSGGDAFGSEHTWGSDKLLKTSHWLKDASTSIGWERFDVTRDTGFVTASLDPNIQRTLYTYDALGRVIKIQPSGEWPTTFCYLPGVVSGGTTTYTPFVIVKKTTANPTLTPVEVEGPTGTSCNRDDGDPAAGSLTGTVMGHNFDGFGRLVREIRRMDRCMIGSCTGSPTTGSYFARREIRYDAAGQRKFVSEWQGCPDGSSSDTHGPGSISNCALPVSVNPSTVPGPSTTYSSFDPFGRPQTITGPNGSSSISISRTDDQVSPSIAFSDTKESVTVSNVNGTCSGSSCSGGSSAVTVTKKDALGRVTSVIEPGGVDTTTYPSYNVLDQLTQVSQGSGSQTRNFAYSAFGFLKSEQTPENGVTGNGTTTYSSYGSLGNLLAKSDDGETSSTAYSYSYDAAGRLTLVSAGSPAVKYLVNCYDGTGICGDSDIPNFAGGSKPKGHLTRRVGWNHIPVQAVPVFDDFSYSGLGGRLSSQVTSIGARRAGSQNWDLLKNGFGLPVTQTWTYNSLGLLSAHSHPRGVGATTSLTVNDDDYASGLLANITATRQGGVTQQVVSARYADTGLFADYTTGNVALPNVKTTVLPLSQVPSRPGQIKAEKVTLSGTTPLWDTGSYTYDGAGNIKVMGGDSFRYDTRSRLTSAKYGSTPGCTDGGFSMSQCFTYDKYGNLTAKAGVNAIPLPTTAGTNHLQSGIYDDRGNLDIFGTENLDFDLLDRQFRNINGTLGTDFVYVYDGGGERVAKFSSTAGAIRREFARIIIEARGDTSLTCPTGTSPFNDVSCDDNPNDGKYIKKMKDIGISGGCFYDPGPPPIINYCPNIQTPRDQSSVFFLKGKHCPLNVNGCTYTPPPCASTHVFADVPCPPTPSAPYGDYIGQLYAEGITVGCDTVNNLFCPTQPLGTWQMLVWAQKIWPTYNPLPRDAVLTYRDEATHVITEANQSSAIDDASATVVYPRDNIFLGSLLVSSAVWADTTPNYQFYASDHLGTPRQVTNISGNSVELRKYWPYGDDVSPPGASAQRLRFAAMERDDETKHYFDHARNHDFNLGRFMSPDRRGGNVNAPHSWNRYTYTFGNPLRYIDPNGLEALDPSVRAFLEAFYRTDLSAVEVHGGFFSRLVSGLFGAKAVTFGNHVLFGRAAFGEYKARTEEGVAVTGHEVKHTLQYQERGTFGFLLTYMAQWAGGGFSYGGIGLEQAAFDAERLIRTLLDGNPDILESIKQGIPLTDEQLQRFSAIAEEESRKATDAEAAEAERSLNDLKKASCLISNVC